MASRKERKSPHFTFIWTLENVAELADLSLASPSFVADTIDASEWSLTLWVLVDKLFCDLSKNHLESPEIEYEIEIIRADESVMNGKRQRKCFSPELVSYGRGSSGVGEIILLQQKDENFKGNLIIRCKMWKPGNESSNSSLGFAHTKFKKERSSFTWIVPEFSSLQVGHRRSFHLQVTPRGNLLRVLDLYIQYDDGEEKVCIEKPKNIPFKLFFKVSVVDAAGNVVCSKAISNEPALIKMGNLLSDTNLYLPNDKLILKCECEIYFGVVSSFVENYEHFSQPESGHVIETRAMNEDCSENSSCPCSCSLKNAVKYYEHGELTDVNLLVGTEIFPAHKIILSAKSRVFGEMFTKDKNIKGRKNIELSDVKPDILRRLLLYIYSENVEDLTRESATQLYKVAIKYELQGLKEKCTDFLKSSLCMDNICDALAFAEKQQDQDLKISTRIFIFEHDVEVFSSVNWKNFKKRNPMLAMDTMQYVYAMRRLTSGLMSKCLQQLHRP